MQKLILQLTYSIVIRWILKLFVGIKFERADFLSHEQQFILVANHNSHLDTMSLMAALPRNIIHKVKPVAAKDHFGKTKWQEKLSNYFINTLLIQRKRDKEHPENDPIHQMVKALDEGYSLILFPEGTRGEPEKEQPLKPGVAMVLAQRPTVKYVPAYLSGMGNAMPKGDNIIVPINASITFGTPKLISHQSDTKSILHQINTDFNRLKKSLR
ncbi:MAG: 1-acyl-sn-glycerol-3-phosphate acyltransferase [Crocinitomicaceae bacterium]|nr:1-acyl-sn-glycerol-3-phosphate acyltransferase [Crocinitomicaceae bacterium]|tara:strand:+ start:216 stop:854 length:639 start_codon:yes stop_codon:yes gene_type:complete